MGQDLIDHAHARLTAVAELRRRDAAQLPPLHRLSRRRLHEEVARRRLGGGRLREALPETETSWAWMRGLLAWVAVGASAAVLVYVIRFPEEPPEAARQTAKAQADEARGVAALSTGPASGPAPASSPVAVSPAAPLADLASAARPVAAPEVARATASGAARAGLVNLAAAELLRQRFTAFSLSGGTLPALSSFEARREGDLVVLREPDGSAYEGRVNPIRSVEGDVRVWVFEGQGYSQTLKANVAITGNFEVPEGSTADAGAAGTGAFLRHPLTGTVMVEGGATVDFRALPADQEPSGQAPPGR